jgi:hypothetical protein
MIKFIDEEHNEEIIFYKKDYDDFLENINDFINNLKEEDCDYVIKIDLCD